jgi:tetratricopeptide (TPR) repeat protein
MKPLLLLLFVFLGTVASAPAQEQTFVQLLRSTRTYDERNENQRALDILREAEKMRPDDPDLLQLIAKQLSQLVSDAPNRREKLALARESVSYAERAVKARPKSAEARLSLAICQGRQAQFEGPGKKIELSKALKNETEAALRLDPNNDYALHVLGRWHFEMATLNPGLRIFAETIYGRFPEASIDQAVKYFEKALAVGPPRVVHHIELGRAYIAVGRTEEGKKQIEKGLRLPSREKDDEETKARGRTALAAT